jgi:predicted ArsR family transcriptional regulator
MTDGSANLTGLQQNILAVLKKTNGIELKALAEKVGINLTDLQRELATLRHMEKIRATQQGDRKVFRLW